MYCPKCGNEVLAEAVKCPKCGYYINSKYDPNKYNKTFNVLTIIMSSIYLVISAILCLRYSLDFIESLYKNTLELIVILVFVIGIFIFVSNLLILIYLSIKIYKRKRINNFIKIISVITSFPIIPILLFLRRD